MQLTQKKNVMGCYGRNFAKPWQTVTTRDRCPKNCLNYLKNWVICRNPVTNRDRPWLGRFTGATTVGSLVTCGKPTNLKFYGSKAFFWDSHPSPGRSWRSSGVVIMAGMPADLVEASCGKMEHMKISKKYNDMVCYGMCMIMYYDSRVYISSVSSDLNARQPKELLLMANVVGRCGKRFWMQRTNVARMKLPRPVVPRCPRKWSRNIGKVTSNHVRWASVVQQTQANWNNIHNACMVTAYIQGFSSKKKHLDWVSKTVWTIWSMQELRWMLQHVLLGRPKRHQLSQLVQLVLGKWVHCFPRLFVLVLCGISLRKKNIIYIHVSNMGYIYI